MPIKSKNTKLAVDNLIHKFKKEVLKGDTIWEVLENICYLNQWGQTKSQRNRGPKAPGCARIQRLGDKEGE